jgi:hypothetical protein
VPSQQVVLGELCYSSVALLGRMYDPKTGLFPYSTRTVDGVTLRHDFEHRHTVRYTINTLLGLQRAGSTGAAPFPGTAAELVDRFLEVHRDSVDDPADLGLLLLLLVEGGREPALLEETVIRARDAGLRPGRRGLALQDLCWLLWGASAAARSGVAGAEPLAHELFALLDSAYVDRDSLLARHSLSRYRSRIVSFGGTVYFLRATYEYAALSGTTRPQQLFQQGLRTVLALQGPQGEWPWMVSVRNGIPLDFYPVFGVHQDSMAMLFLLPALDESLADVADAIQTSLAWSRGANELGEPMYGRDFFFAYRSIRRSEPFFRKRRYLRSLARAVSDRPGGRTRPQRLMVNRECRSYHLGWILYVWGGRPDQPQLSST